MRLFLTCWLAYAMHFWTDFVREHYLVISIVEDHSFDLGKYLGLHPDIFTNPPSAPHAGVHHGANPGISMLGAVAYAPFRPVVDWVVRRELAARGDKDTLAVFQGETRPHRLAFYAETRRRGLDVRFGLVAMITAVLCMAPLTAASVVVVLRLLSAMGLGNRLALGLSLAYAFATPTFLRASYLNQNLAIGIFSVLAFLLVWNPGGRLRMRSTWRHLIAGFLGGFCLLSDYSGGLSLAALGAYLLYVEWQERGVGAAVRAGAWYTVGAALPILALWFYQWQSFGNAFLPPQQWMPPVEGSDVGYQGVGLPQLDLFSMLLFDPRFGIFACSPLLILALLAPYYARKGRSFVPPRELVFCFAITAAYVVFFSCVQYTRLQWVSVGPRYLAPIFAFLFLAAAVALVRLPRLVSLAMIAVSFLITWSLTMTRSQAGIVDALEHTLLGGLQLPALTTFARMSTQYAPWLNGNASPLPAFGILALLLAAIWLLPHPWRPLPVPVEAVGAAAGVEATGAPSGP